VRHHKYLGRWQAECLADPLNSLQQRQIAPFKSRFSGWSLLR
jgi:hypothetical protein